jgi:hypothetical protein
LRCPRWGGSNVPPKMPIFLGLAIEVEVTLS